jgi:type II secretory pathway component PulF
LNARRGDTEPLAILREIASLYWDREQTKAVWVLSWLQPIAVLMISFVVGFVVLALFMPLVELISGLS